MGTQPVARRRRLRIYPPSDLILEAPKPSNFVTLEDNSPTIVPATRLFDVSSRREPFAEAARLTEQLILNNRSGLSVIGINAQRDFSGSEVVLRLSAGNKVGAMPLLSPLTGKADYGVVVRPRFPWEGLGAMLAQMGWRVTPEPVKAPPFKGSERSIPPWVLSAMILPRIDHLLKSMVRKFDMVNEVRNAPKGLVNWGGYGRRSLPIGRFLSVSCTFPDLQQDRHLLGAIRYCLERIIESLGSQVEHGTSVHRLIDYGQQLLLKVKHVPVFLPSPTQMEQWLRRPLKTDFYREGLDALRWTIENRGLAGTSNLEGIPWVMDMDAFFEGWIETIFHSVARTTGGLMKTGRQRQTTRPIAWDPPYLGSQKSLIPDLYLHWGSKTLIADAKYKRHFEELQVGGWGEIEAEWKEQHRNDLLQVLAYANLAESRTIISCLVYPCTPLTWERLKQSNRIFHKAMITVGDRVLHLWLTAAPMKAAVPEVAAPLIRELMPVLQENG